MDASRNREHPTLDYMDILRGTSENLCLYLVRGNFVQ
jgi:hypothetical protein